MRAPSVSIPGLGWRRSAASRAELGIAGFAALLAAAVAALVVAPEDVLNPALIAITALLCAAPIAVRVIQGRWDPFEPIVIVCAAGFVLFVLRPLWMWWHDEWTLFVYDARDNFTAAAAIGVLGMLGLTAGYALPFGSRLAARIPVIRDDWDPARVTRACMGTIVIAGFMFMIYIGTEGGFAAARTFFSGRGSDAGATGPNSAYFILAPYMTIPVALLLIEVWRRVRSSTAGILAIFAILAALAMTIPRGNRTWILALVMPLIFVPYLFRNRRPTVIAIVGTILVSVLVANVLLQYRNTQNRDEPLPALAAEAVTDPTAQFDHFMLGADTVMFSALAVEAGAIPSRFSFDPGKVLTSTLASPVPGLLWRGKPQPPGYGVYRELYRRARGGPVARNGIAVSLFGGFYADSWMVGVFLYSLLCGVLFRALFEWWRGNRANRSVTIAYAAMLPILVMLFRASVTLAFGATIVLIVPLVGILWWANRHGSAPGRPTGAGSPAAA